MPNCLIVRVSLMFFHCRYDQMKGYLIATKIGIFKDGLINHFVYVMALT